MYIGGTSVTVTLAVGSELRAMVMVSTSPPSTTFVVPPDWVTTSWAPSLSVMLALTPGQAQPVYKAIEQRIAGTYPLCFARVVLSPEEQKGERGIYYAIECELEVLDAVTAYGYHQQRQAYREQWMRMFRMQDTDAGVAVDIETGEVED